MTIVVYLVVESRIPEQVLAYAASSEIHSRHPLAQAVIRSTEERHIAIPPHEQCEVLLGQGMRVRQDGRTLLLGRRELLRAQDVPVSRRAHDWVRRLQRATETPLLLAVDGALVGLVSLRDTVRPESRDVLEALRSDGVTRIVLLTGDHPDTAACVAAELGITELPRTGPARTETKPSTHPASPGPHRRHGGRWLQ